MTEFSKRDLANSSFLGGLLLLLCALTFYYFAVLRIDYQKTALLDLRPYPDATEYFAQGKELSKGRYAFNTDRIRKAAVKVSAWLSRTDAPMAEDSPSNAFRSGPVSDESDNRPASAFDRVYLLRISGDAINGGVAALLLATLPGFFTFCRSSLSDLSASLFVVLAFMFAYLGFKEERRWKLYLSAVLLGVSLNIRIQSLFFAPLLLVMPLLPVKGMRWRWFLHCAALPVVFVLAASPVLLLNTIQFHSPLKTGYDFWIPYFGEKHLFFLLRYVPRNAGDLWSELSLQPHMYDAANIFGTSTFFVPAFVLLGCVGMFFVRPNWFLCCGLLAGLSSFARTPAQVIKITGARQHNLKNLRLEIAHEKLVVITGLRCSREILTGFRDACRQNIPL